MVRHLLLGSGSSFLLSFGMLVFLARAFPLEFVSDAKAATIYSGWIALVFSGQVHTALLYFSRQSDAEGKGYREFTVVYLLFAAALAAIVFFVTFGELYTSKNLTTVGLGAYAVFTALSLFFYVTPAVFAALGESRSIPGLTIAFGSASLLGLLMSYMLGWDVNSYAVASAILATGVLGSSRWKKYILEATAAPIANLRRFQPTFGGYAAKMSASLILESLGDRMDKILSARLLPSAAFAKYSVLCFENPIVNLLLASHGIALVSRFGRNFDETKIGLMMEWRRLVAQVTFVTFPISIFLILNAQWFVSTVFGYRYLDAVVVFQIYMSVTLVRFAPFQALLRLKGAVGYNVLISTLFLLTASIASSLLLWSNAGLEYLAVAYLSAWFVFNASAALIFSSTSGVSIREVILPALWMGRLLQTLVVAVLAQYMSDDNIYLNGLVFTAGYIGLVYFLDVDVKRLIDQFTKNFILGGDGHDKS